jgi:uncharacterized membrane protein
MAENRDLFEMRRLEALSNTVFGVAMTLLAYEMPRAGAFAEAPDWTKLLHVYARPMAALALSFAIAGMFWLSHHRRLAQAPEVGRSIVMLNLAFLLTIVLLPVTNGLYSGFRFSEPVAIVYCVHLTLIAGINALLWLAARSSGATDAQVASAVFPAFVFLIAAIAAVFNPGLAQYLMFPAFGAPLIGWIMRRSRA